MDTGTPVCPRATLAALFFIERVWVWRVEVKGQLLEVGLLLLHVGPGIELRPAGLMVSAVTSWVVLFTLKFTVASVWTSVCMHYCVHMPCCLWKPAHGKSSLSACTVRVTDTELWQLDVVTRTPTQLTIPTALVLVLGLTFLPRLASVLLLNNLSALKIFKD